MRELPGRPGVFGCTMHLQPHFQLDDMAATFRLVTDIAAPGATKHKETRRCLKPSIPPSALFRAGKLAPAIEAANAAVRKSPADLGGRVLLAELLLFAGNLERADTILDAAAQIDPTAMVGGRRISPAIRAAMARRQYRREGRVPEFLGEPTPALRCGPRRRWSHCAPAIPKRRPAMPPRPRRSGRAFRDSAGDVPFDDFRDVDDFHAGFFEVLTTTGKYFWIPTERVARSSSTRRAARATWSGAAPASR